MKKKNILISIATVLIIVAIAVGLHFLIRYNRSKTAENEAAEAYAEEIAMKNASLILDKITVPERSADFDKEIKPVEADTPENLKDLNYIVISNKTTYKRWKVEGSISSIPELSMDSQWTDDDYKKIDVVVFAVSVVTSAKYKRQSGVGGTVRKSSEGVYLFYYNTRTKTFFKRELMYSKALPEKTSSSASYSYSIDQIGHRVKAGMGRFVFTAGLAWFLLILIIGIFVAVLVIKNKLKKWKAAHQKH